jgi:glutamyl-Q tRNA(Asp) synthetase
MEDLDPPREEPGAAKSILHSLQCHGLHWHEQVLFQSTRAKAYAASLDALAVAGNLFHCDCTRAALGPDGACCGRCRYRQDEIFPPRSSRVSVPRNYSTHFEDQLQGQQVAPLGLSTPDFVVKRKDGLDAYQLAVVVDDAEQGITQIVRGSDLLDSTPRQIFLQHLLGYPTPGYCHLPVITTGQGQKFSKQNNAPALDNRQAADNLRHALQFLHQQEPPPTADSVEAMLAFAAAHWAPQRIPAVLAIPAASIGIVA